MKLMKLVNMIMDPDGSAAPAPKVALDRTVDRAGKIDLCIYFNHRQSYNIILSISKEGEGELPHVTWPGSRVHC